MLVHKVYHRRSAVTSLRDRVYPNADGKLMEGKPLLGAESEDDPDDPDLPDICCELAMVKGQTCSIPYELYDLPDLKEILSLDTWNSCLTAEERFALSAFLPDMDQQTLCMTLNDLFSGANLFFGNPVDTFYKRLKGGLYPPKVARLRELSQLLQMRKYYLSLSSYHGRMLEMFVSIKRFLDRCDRGVGVDEKLSMWRTMRNGGDNNLLDLNSVPAGRYMFSKDPENDMLCHLPTNFMTFKSFRGTSSSPSPSAKPFTSPDSSMNPALNMKTYINGSLMHNVDQKILVEETKEYRGVPKGLLKVVQRVPSVHPEHQKMLFGRREPAAVGAKHFAECEFPFLPVSSYLGNAFGANGWPSLSPKIVSNEASITLLPLSGEGTKREFPDFGEHDFFPHNIEGAADEGYKSLQDTAVVRRYGYGHENIWKFLDIRNEGYLGRSFESYPFSGHNHGGHQARSLRNNFIMCPSVRQRVSGIGDSSREKLAPLCKTVKYPSDVKVDKPVHSGKSSLSEGPKDDFTLILTYKRRKAQAKA